MENPTKAEASIEPAIAALGLRYRPQHPFWGLKYFADFALLDEKLIIEVDGDSHDDPKQKEKDLLHELAVLKLGWRIGRVTNAEALSDPTRAVQAALGKARSLQTETATTQAEGRLLRLRKSSPSLLADAATKAKHLRQSNLAGAELRRQKIAQGAYPQRKRAAPAPGRK